MTKDAALAWIRAHEADSNEHAALALLALLDEETAALRAYYRRAVESTSRDDKTRSELERKMVGQ